METPTEQIPENEPVPYAEGRKSNSLWAENKLLIKGVLIALLILAMLIPSGMITALIKERADRQQEVIAEVSRKWAEPQTLVGPVLMVPYLERSTNSSGETTMSRNTAYFLPEKLNIDGRLNMEERH